MKKYACIIALTSILPILTIYAHGRNEGYHAGNKHQGMHHDHRLNNRYGSYGTPGNTPNETIVAPLTTPIHRSQPGMTDDHNNLYHSYQKLQYGH